MDLIKSLGLQLDHPQEPQANFKPTLPRYISLPQRAICPVLARFKHPDSLLLLSVGGVRIRSSSYQIFGLRFMTRKF